MSDDEDDDDASFLRQYNECWLHLIVFVEDAVIVYFRVISVRDKGGCNFSHKEVLNLRKLIIVRQI